MENEDFGLFVKTRKRSKKILLMNSSIAIDLWSDVIIQIIKYIYILT